MAVFSACERCNNTTRGDTIYQCKNAGCKQRYCSSCKPWEECEECGKKPAALSLASQFKEVGRIK